MSEPENFQFFSGSSALSRKRRFCSFFEMCRKNLITMIPLRVRYRSKLRMSRKRPFQMRFVTSVAGILCFARYLTRNGIIVIKFFLHISKKEQKRRFLERAEEPEKNWKFSGSDMAEREHWDEYLDAYEDMIRNTATKHSPWYVVPANNKWFTRVVVAAAVVDTLASLDLAYPQVDRARLEEIASAKRALL